jgi:hypothetical protein
MRGEHVMIEWSASDGATVLHEASLEATACADCYRCVLAFRGLR